MTVTVCAIMKDERQYIAEWVAYYQILGFDNIVIYCNDSTDGSEQLLLKLKEYGVLEFYDWPSGDHFSPQMSAYLDAISKCETDWIMFVDADEFLVLKQHSNVNDFLNSFKSEVSGIAINWRIFGSSGLIQNENRLVIDRFRRASESMFYVNYHVKSFVRPKHVKEVHMHACEVIGKYVTPLGNPIVFKRQGISPLIDTACAQVNHYIVKSWDEYLFKRLRGNANRHVSAEDKFTRYTDDLFTCHDKNDEIDEAATPLIPEINKLILSWEVI